MANDPYGELLGSAPQSSTSNDPYGDLLAPSPELRAASTVAHGTNPDQYAKLRKDANAVGYPVAAAEALPEQTRRAAALKNIDDSTVDAPVLRKKYTDADFNKLAQDEPSTLASLEKSLRGFFDGQKPTPTNNDPQVLNSDEYSQRVRKFKEQYNVDWDTARSMAAQGMTLNNTTERIGNWDKPQMTLGNWLNGKMVGFVQGLEQMRQGINRQFADAIGSDSMGERARLAGIRAQGQIDLNRPQFESATAQGLDSGVDSLLQNAPGLALSVLTANPAPALATIGLQSEAQNYSKYRDRGASGGMALLGAVGEGSMEVATELLPMKVVVDKLGKVGFGHFMKEFLGKEMVGEQLNTAVNDAIDTAIANPDKTWSQYLAERPGAAYQTALATLVQSGVLASASHVLSKTTMAKQASDFQIAQAIVADQKLRQTFALATQSKLRERSPQTFAETAQEMAEKSEGAPTEVRFDARTLGEVLNQEEIAKLPSLAGQMQEALATGGEVSVPIGELMANVAGTPLEQKLTEHARVGDAELSAFEAKEAQSQAESYLQEEAKRVISEAVDSVGHQASADAVKASLLEQFTKLGRFTPDVNSAYATIASNMYTALGSRLGMTPEQAYAAHPLTITGVNPAMAGETLSAGTRTGEVSVEGYHYSKQQRTHVSTDMFGTGLAGSSKDEYLNAQDKRLSKRAYFYVDKGTGINPEAGVGGYAHKAQLSNIYDADTDPLRLNKGGKLAFESAVLDAGFSGYMNRLGGTQSGQVVMLGDQAPTAVESLGSMGKTSGAVVPAKGTRESLGRDKIVDALQANAALPSGSPTIARWQELLANQPDVLQALTDAGVFDGDQTKNVYKSELIKDFENKTEAPVYNQSATLRAGKETLEKYGLPPGGKYKTRDIAAALEARQRELYGTIDPTDRSEESANKIANWMAEEVRFEMQHPRKSGVGWYSYKFQRALDTFAEEFPELKKDKDARATLTALIAITSDGQKVLPNFRMAMDLYRNFSSTGKFTTERGHSRMDSIQGNVNLLQKMLDDMGPKAMRKYLLQEATVSELRKRAKAEGVDFKTDYQAHVKLPMAAVTFGPKLGAFYANLMGAHGYLTMDRWWSRTFNRYRGTLIQAPTADGLARVKELLGHPEWSDDQAIAATVEHRKSYEAKNFKRGTEIEKAANTVYKAAFEGLEDAPFNATDRTFMLNAVAKAQQLLESEGRKISIADIQAVLWYYEKRLYGELGARDSADISYEDAAKKVVAEQPDAGTTGRSNAQGAGQSAGADDAGTTSGVSQENDAPGLDDFEPNAGELNGQDTYQQSGSGDRGGRAESRSLAPLEGAPSVPGFNGPDVRVVAVAERYARDNGITLKRQSEYVKVDPERAKRLADAYEAMAHAPQDPAVKEAYENLIKQTTAQYQALADAGYKFWFIDPSIPSNADYASTPWNAMRDMRANQQMGVFATSDGFGTSEEFNPEDNPLFADTGIKWPVGGPDGPLKPVLANDLFRAVHDAFGHGLEGAGFRAEGEENAWQAHSRLFTGSALGAITSETRGQNSWLNYGPHGETNQTAKVEDTHFADQKTGLMPEWTWTEGRAGNEGENKYQAKYLAGRQLDSLNAEERAQYDAMATPSDVLNAPNARGTFNPKSMTISLLEGADLSTFHHEMAHFYLEVLANIASQPNAPVAIVNDMMELLKWFGVKDLPTWNAMSLNEKRASHEKFAEHYEQYLFEGKSPNPEMQTLFRRFASWMKNVYQSLQAFMLSHNSNLTPEVRGVYDRMLATEAQIDQAEAARNYAPLFKSAEQAGMTPEAWALYQLQAQDATEQAIENLQARSLRDLKWTMRAKNKAFKEATKDVEAKRKAVEAEVSDEVNAMPVYAAKSYLDSLKGERTDADIQLASELFGYSSPNEMLRDITEAQPIKHVIEGMTDQRLLERYGDLTTPAGIERAANEAVHNEARARFVATELKALNEGMRITTPERSTILEKLKECLAS